MISILTGVFLGLLAGLLCIIPGIHPNLIATLLPLLQSTNYPQELLISFIAGLLTTYNFISILPSLFFQYNSEGINLHPAQKYLAKGLAQKAILLSIFGTLIGTASAILSSATLIHLLPPMHSLLKGNISIVLIVVAVTIILVQKNKIASISIILLSSALGLVALVDRVSNPLLPLLTGFFAIPPLIKNLKSKNNTFPLQKPVNEINLKIKKITLPTAIISPLFSFLPGVGTSQALSLLPKKFHQSKIYLCLVGAMNAAATITAFLALYTLQKSRNGVIANLSGLISIEKPHLFIFKLSTLLTITPAIFITLFIGKKLQIYCGKISLSKIAIITLPFLILINLLFSDMYSLPILMSSTTISLFAEKLNVQKSNLMFSILIPVLFFFLELEF